MNNCRNCDRDIIERFNRKIIVVNTCWEWQGELSHNGYGRFWVNNKRIPTHRFTYELYKGKIDSDKEIDHLCKNRKCCNPQHLDMVTRQENIKRGVNYNKLKSHCINGHEYNKVNTLIRKTGGRMCRLCNRLRMRKGTGNKFKTHCIHGHEFNEKNTYITKHGNRQCKVCYSERQKLRSVKN